MKTKYYASYLSPSEFEIHTENEFNAMIAELQENEESGRAHDLLNQCQLFVSLAEAKRYLLMHFRGDRDESIHNIRLIRKIKDSR